MMPDNMKCIVCGHDNCHFRSIRVFNDSSNNNALTVVIVYVCEDGHAFSNTQFFNKGIIYVTTKQEDINSVFSKDLNIVNVNDTIVLERGYYDDRMR